MIRVPLAVPPPLRFKQCGGYVALQMMLDASAWMTPTYTAPPTIKMSAKTARTAIPLGDDFSRDSDSCRLSLWADRETFFLDGIYFFLMTEVLIFYYSYAYTSNAIPPITRLPGEVPANGRSR